MSYLLKSLIVNMLVFGSGYTIIMLVFLDSSRSMTSVIINFFGFGIMMSLYTVLMERSRLKEAGVAYDKEAIEKSKSINFHSEDSLEELSKTLAEAPEYVLVSKEENAHRFKFDRSLSRLNFHIFLTEVSENEYTLSIDEHPSWLYYSEGEAIHALQKAAWKVTS